MHLCNSSLLFYLLFFRTFPTLHSFWVPTRTASSDRRQPDTFARTRRTTTTTTIAIATRLSHSNEKNAAAQDALERTAAHLKKLQALNAPQTIMNPNDPPDPLGVEREKMYHVYIKKPANSLKEILKERKLPRNGRKPDLARRLAENDLLQRYGDDNHSDGKDFVAPEMLKGHQDADFFLPQFAGMPISPAAGRALARANFLQPSPIQAAAIPSLARGESLVLHAETGSGKTIAYLLPLTEALWSGTMENDGRFLVLTPTRELAAQVAGVATALAPPGAVRMVNHPTNLMTDGQKDRGEGEYGGRVDATLSTPRLIIGSAKAVMHSLYGDGKTPASPTPKPLAMEFLQSINCVVLDEVDRLLNVSKSRAEKQYKKIHERPAAVLVAAVMRLSLGATQIVAASATVGRPLKRELTRVMGLPPQECPRVVVASTVETALTTNRAVTIPSSVQHYVMEADGQSDGKLLTTAYRAIQQLNHKPQRILLVLSRGFGLNPKNVVGALRHFRCRPEPENLLDRLEAHGGTDDLINVHRQVSGASGIGEKAKEEDDYEPNTEYLLVTGEDSVRGLHLDGLDVVFCIGRANSPDEYTHIAGRTGRAGQSGKVINIVAGGKGHTLATWESTLGVRFELLKVEDMQGF